MNSNNTYNQRRSGNLHGDVYTKPEVVGFMLDEVGYAETSNLSDLSIMEPSCGEGEFLMEIINRLFKSSCTFGFDFDESFHKCIFASDIDEFKIAKCINRIKTQYPQLSNLEKNIVAEDYLLENHRKVDIVIGNPPYIRYEEIPEDKLCLYKKFPTFYYRSDIYVPFFEKSLSQLKPNGKHCFICANRWMKNQYGKMLRELIAKYYSIEKIINMEKCNAFQEEVLAYPAITLIQNETASMYLQHAEVENIEELNNISYSQIEKPKGNVWSDIFNANSNDLHLIETQGFRIGIGVATGADSIFISKELKGKVEDDLLIPVINARDLTHNNMCWGGRYLLNPYDESGNLINLQEKPLAKEYLEEYKDRLSIRHKARKNPDKWYGTIDSISPTLKGKVKILLPDITCNNYIFVDNGKYYPQHNVYYITGPNKRQLYLLAAILMSDYIREQLNKITNHMNGGLVRWQSQYLRQLRIPLISGIAEELADKLLKCYNEKDIEGINYYVNEIVTKEKLSPKQAHTKKQTLQLSIVF